MYLAIQTQAQRSAEDKKLLSKGNFKEEVVVKGNFKEEFVVKENFNHR